MRARLLATGLGLGLLTAPAVTIAQNLGAPVIVSTYRSLHSADTRGRRLPHAGVDFANPVGAPVLAAADGTVSRIIEWPMGCGLGLLLEHQRFARWTAYCHLQAVTVRKGQRVSRGEQIGMTGTSGSASSIPHVHLEVCTFACGSHSDGDLTGTEDPLAVADGCFEPGRIYPADRFVLTFPVACSSGARGR
jgi:murein DD-endopeptidase MepM/ murein hydrolase activator NlpD